MKEIEEILERNKIRVTASRLLVYRYLYERRSVVALSEIENAFGRADRSTLYRTIKTFEENRIVHQIDDGTGVLKYALCEPGCNCNIKSDLHLHFHCNECNETKCLTDHKIPPIEVPDGFVAENANLVIKGVCDKCNLN
ncbi:Fur family transcriptional regulator [Robertkochia solimangrovi]|uniref:Fur family transcriptional regulator n=1 Tax=Robertkochia solimangrovi TaxID=2213046 RepID=UPI00117C3BFB|nr:transcriptional repressor [Robertkochia solimangrovi]TRZ43176.1 transcriptional repressor [Robertkochia solimangrovi]